MKVLFVFNHPAPYKVELLNRISKSIDLMVLFERRQNADRNPSFYASNKIEFPHQFLKGIPFGNENFLSWQIKKHIKENKYDLIVMNGYSTIAEIIALNYLIKHKIPYVLYVNGGVIRKDKPLKLKLKRIQINFKKLTFNKVNTLNLFTLFHLFHISELLSYFVY